MEATTMAIGISRLGQVAINVHDVARATAFYRDRLGLPLLFTAGNLAFFDCGGVRLMLDRAEKPEFDHPSSILYFAVPDIDADTWRLSVEGQQVQLIYIPARGYWFVRGSMHSPVGHSPHPRTQLSIEVA